MRLIDAEEFKHKINNSELYGTDVWAKVLDMLAECETRNSTIETAIKDYYESTKSNNTNKILTNTNNTMYWQKDAFDGIHCSNCWYKIETTGTPSICPCCGHHSINSL